MTGGAPIAPDDLNWHDGVLVDLHVSGLMGTVQHLDLICDLYAEGVDSENRLRLRCRAESVRAFRSSLDLSRLMRHRGAGNINYCHMIEEDGVYHLTLMLFGGTLEVSATQFSMERINE